MKYSDQSLKTGIEVEKAPKMKKSQENNMSNKIDQEIENMAKSMEEVTSDPKEETIKLIKSLGPEGLKKAIPNLNEDQKIMLKSVLEEMNKGMDFEQTTPKKEMTKLAESGAELEEGSDDEDEKLVVESNSQHSHQGGSNEPGEAPWEGQVIKSLDPESIVDEILEKAYGMTKMCKADDEDNESKAGKKVLDVVDEIAEDEAKEKVKDHEKKMHKKEMKKSDLIDLKNEVIKSYQDAGLSYNDDLIKAEMKKRLLAEENQVEMGGQDKGGKADKADKNAPKEIKPAMDADTKADSVKEPSMKKSLVFEKDEYSLLKACTNGRNYHFSINSYYDEALEGLSKSESEEVDEIEEEFYKGRGPDKQPRRRRTTLLPGLNSKFKNMSKEERQKYRADKEAKQKEKGRKVAQEIQDAKREGRKIDLVTALKKSDINDLIEKGLDMDSDSVLTNQLLNEHKVNGNYSESFSSVDLLDAMGLNEEEAKNILGEE